MTELERRAMLGDVQAQEECTEKGIALPCPHCAGNGKVSFKDHRFVGQNVFGDKKLVYRVQVICNKCRSRGKPIFTDPLVNPNPYITKWGNSYAETETCKKETERFLPYVLLAVSEWNTRPMPPIGRCKNCAYKDKTKVSEKGFLVCPASGMEITDEDYCSYFEPKP